MTTLTEQAPGLVTVGVDTHNDFHVAVVIDSLGRMLDSKRFDANSDGYRCLHQWASTFGTLDKVGIEGTGSWGVGLSRHLNNQGVDCVEVSRPNRQHRRRYGKSDHADAHAAAKAVQSGEASNTPRNQTGPVEGLRVNRVAHRSAVKARTQAMNQLRALIVSASDDLRERLDGLTMVQITKTAARFRSSGSLDEREITKQAMRSLARRIVFLNNEIADLEAVRSRLVKKAAPPALLEEFGIGPGNASDLLITFGSNPGRIGTDSAFAALCGVSAVDASSGRQQRHRLNRGGDRQANSALWRIVLVRMASHQPTQSYIAERMSQGKTKREAMRSLKRYVARRIWKILSDHQSTIDNP